VGTKRSRAELIQLLAEQRLALAASCESYDKGNDWEAARLATTIFTLVHDGGSINSVLTQLGVRGSLRFFSSGTEVNPKTLTASAPLVMFRAQLAATAKSKAVPLLDGGPPGLTRRTQFSTWWAQESIYKDGQSELTRRRLIFALRHQDGGGHVGELTDEAYVRLKTQAICLLQVNDEPDVPMYALTATMRQIAWELTKTLDDYGPIQ
jgi:hypothetical protein